MKKLTLLWIFVFASQIFAQQQQRITMNFSVWDRNKSFDAELKDSDIEIKQGRNNLQIVSVEKVVNENLDIVLMIDASGSQEKTLEAEKLVAIKFVENILKNDKDRLAIIKFAQEVEVEQDFSSDISKAINTIKTISLQKLGRRNTSLWDSVQKVAGILNNNSANKKTIILISDGIDNASKMRLDELIKSLINLQIPVYSFHSRGEIWWSNDGQLNLERISKQTGGFPFFPINDKEIQIAASQINQSLRKNFKVIFLVDTLKQNDKIQKVEISIVNPALKNERLKIVQPKGFFFPISK